MDWCPVSDVAQGASIMDVGKQAVERLAYQMAETIERVTANAIINNLSVAGQNVHHRFKTSTEFTDYYGMTSTISAGVMTVSATNILAVSDIKNAVFELKRMGAKPWTGNDYIAIMPTEVAEDIAGDSTFTGFHQYVEKGVDALYNGELGKVYGCRLIDAPNGPCKRGSNYGSTASSIAYATIVMGKGFYGAVEFFGEGMETYMVKGASKSDPLNQFSIFGWKANYTAKVLNPSAGLVLWTGSRDTTAACAESANSGLRNEDPSSY